MNARKPPQKKKQFVWRISADTPNGSWVDPATSPIAAHEIELSDAQRGGWTASSFDLLNGCDVIDEPSTLSDAQLDELFPQKRDAPGATEAQ